MIEKDVGRIRYSLWIKTGENQGVRMPFGERQLNELKLKCDSCREHGLDYRVYDKINGCLVGEHNVA